MNIQRAAALLAALTFAAHAVPTAAAVTIGGIRYSIKEVHIAATVGEDMMEQRASGEYIIVRREVANVGDKPATVSSSDFHLVAGGTTFDSASEALMAVQGAFFLTTINPGTARVGTLLFDVPAHSAFQKYSLEVYGNGGSDPTYMRL